PSTWSSSLLGSSRKINSTEPSGDVYVGVGVSVDEGDSPAERDGAGDAKSFGSTFVKYGELFAELYQSGKASSCFNPLPDRSTVQNSRTLFDFSRVKTITLASGAKMGSESCPVSSCVNCRNSFPSSR